MSQLANKSNRVDPRDETETEGLDPPGAAQSGRPAFDRRGTTVWEWQTATGTYSRDPSTTRVQKLEAPELSLEKTVIIKQPEIEEPKLNVAPCGGFNPYDHAPTARTRPIAAPPPVATTPPSRPATRPITVPPPRPTTLLGRLRALLSGR